ncbi:hypothetical protein [Microbulbifer hydrolyticus]|uniref:DNA-binding protein Fis n=1 Tax=Microbulbifer hydrolyticus TaxID=48074 RepID=A0A6P1TAC9_9GAMM|nr:hypothetical protein [Microbulbifer hydrolyticus]MBB5210968.1 DNA-binding protein Fis [Microbulbifer hydrolyticus]QHQ38219.1 hypothetical protein GTQ55_03905 [Microbulbifer hydrolyticus]
MASLEEMELDKHRETLRQDIDKLVDKYLREIEWSVPDVDEQRARELILAEIEQHVKTLRGGSSLTA